MKRYLQQAMGLILVGCMASDSFAIGSAFISNEVPSARAAGAGYVGVAGQNEDPTAVFSNPGAMTALPGTQATFGTTWENIHGGYVDSAGNQTKERVTNVGVPNFSATQSFLDGKLSAGLSSQSPFGLETYWPGNSPLRYVATDSRLDMVDIMPAVAYQVHPMVSIGAGADYVSLFNATLNRAVNVTATNFGLAAQGIGTFAGPSPDGSSSLTGQSTAWGYHAGVVFKPTEQHALGVTYHSKVDLRVLGSVSLADLSGTLMGVFGGSSYSTSAFTDVVLPASIQIGYAFKPNDKWILEADAAWYDWASAQDINVRYAETNPLRLAILNTGNPTPLSPRDAWSFNTGANYKLNERWQVRGGFWYEPEALPDANFNPAFMDLTRYGLSTGFGYAFNANIGMDAAYTAVFMHNRTIVNTVGTNITGIPPSQYNIDGTYSDFANLVTVNLTCKFGGGK